MRQTPSTPLPEAWLRPRRPLATALVVAASAASLFLVLAVTLGPLIH